MTYPTDLPNGHLGTDYPTPYADAASVASTYPGDPVRLDGSSPTPPPPALGDRTAPPTCLTPPSAFLMSLNGFDEITVANHFGAGMMDLRDDPITGGRALAFVHERRTGKPDKEAYDTCMRLTMQEVMNYFAPEPKRTDAEGNGPGA